MREHWPMDGGGKCLPGNGLRVQMWAKRASGSTGETTRREKQEIGRRQARQQ
jgi:hypothetical protein